MPTTLFRRYPAYASVGAGLVVAALVCWIVVPPTQVIANTAAYEQTEPTDPAQAMEQQGSEEGQESEGQGADDANAPQDDAAAQQDGSDQQAAVAATPVSSYEERLASLPDDVHDWNLLVVGDSVAETAHEEFGQQFPNGAMDARVSRPVSEGVDVMRGWANDGWNGDAVLFVLGANTLVSAGEFEREYQELLDAVPDGVPIFVANVRSPEVQDGPNNEVIGRLANEQDGVYFIDWYSGTADHSDWFEPDGIHVKVGPTGAQHMLDFWVDSIDAYQEEAKQTVGTTAASSAANNGDANANDANAKNATDSTTDTATATTDGGDTANK